MRQNQCYRKEVQATRQSIEEYVQALRPRYRIGTKEEKGRMLDEFTKVSGLHPKAAIRLLRKSERRVCKRRGRKREYIETTLHVLRCMQPSVFTIVHYVT